MININGNKKLKRDPKSFGVVNVDKQEFVQLRTRQYVISQLTSDNLKLKSDLNDIREEMQKIKNLLQVKQNGGIATS